MVGVFSLRSRKGLSVFSMRLRASSTTRFCWVLIAASPPRLVTQPPSVGGPLNSAALLMPPSPLKCIAQRIDSLAWASLLVSTRLEA